MHGGDQHGGRQASSREASLFCGVDVGATATKLVLLDGLSALTSFNLLERPRDVAFYRDLQAMAVRAFDAGAPGLSWWSTLDSAWTNVTLFAERTLDRGAVVLDGPTDPLTLTHPAVVAAADQLTIPIVRRRRRR